MTDPIPWSCVPLEEGDLTLPPPRRCRINLCGAQHYEAWKPSSGDEGQGLLYTGAAVPGGQGRLSTDLKVGGGRST